MRERIRFYLCFWWACAAEAWRGSWGTANTLSAIIGGAIVAVLSIVLRLKMEAPSSVQGVVLFGFVIAAFSTIAVWVVIYAVRLVGSPARLYETIENAFKDMSKTANSLQERIRPKFRLSFHPDAEGLQATPIIVSQGLFGSPQILTKEFMATYVRIRVEALSETTVRGCTAFLTKLQRESADGKTVSDIALPHSVSLRGGQPFDAQPNVVHTADFLMCSSENNELVVPESNWPFALRTIFDETGTYHFTITVNGGGVSDSITVSVGWPGRWDKITGRQIIIPNA